MTVQEINQVILDNKSNPDFKENDICDGYHTFDELYEFRKVYNAALFNEWGANVRIVEEVVSGTLATSEYGSNFKINYNSQPKYDVHKSWRHNDGELCFGGGWFIVSAMLPTGLISNHYKAADWDLFKIPEVAKAKYPFDGHTGVDVIERLKAL